MAESTAPAADAVAVQSSQAVDDQADVEEGNTVEGLDPALFDAAQLEELCQGETHAV